VIPIALQTNALILVHHSSCALSAALSNVLRSIETQMGNGRGFNVINFGWAAHFHMVSTEVGNTSV
jgi:hypothetical protein